MGAAKIVGILCIVFGIADVALSWLGVADLTGVTWSPIVAFVAGSVLMRVGGDDSE
jgi:hypothetical protein